MHILSLALDVILAGYIAWEVVQFVPRYRQLKQALADGHPGARTRIYYQALVFEWASALLALLAIGFDWSKLNPKFLGLDGVPMIRAFSLKGAFGQGVIFGVLAGLAAFIVRKIKATRSGIASAPARPTPWSKLWPDFSALIPVTARERFLWAAVAISAGICEELVFRGWLLATLHDRIGLAGIALLSVAAAIFGLAHAYQGITGVILTALVGVFFCALYVATGSLLFPILLHSLIDLRFALMPSPREKLRAAVYA